MNGPLGLPFRHVILLDTEFVGRDETGDNPIPVCVVARDLGTGQLWREMADDHGPFPPFPIGDDTLVVTFSANAEWRYFIEVGWPLPARVVDLYVEAKLRRNGRTVGRPTLLSELAAHGIPAITSDQKEAGRALAGRGFPYTEAERRELLDYCQTDVDVLAPLLEVTLQWLRATDRLGLGHALLRGRYTCAQAWMESTGGPIDVDTYEALSEHWEPVQLAMIGDLNERWPVYNGTSFSDGAFRDELWRRGLRDWPLTATRQLDVSQKVLRDRAKSYPPLYEVYEVRHALGGMRMNDLHVGTDGRNRCWLNPFHTKTGRNQPSSSGFVFALPAWMRFLCQARPGHVMVGLDWKAQEIAIAAVLSGDDGLLADVASGDPYCAFGIRIGLMPTGATKHTHSVERELCKTVLIAAGYGIGSRTLAARLGCTVIEATELLRRLRAAYPSYYAWSAALVDDAYCERVASTCFGWSVAVGHDTRPNAVRNFPMQSFGAEMLRLACCLATEAGLPVVAPVHDALVLEVPAAELDEVVAAAVAAMGSASMAVIGYEAGVDCWDHTDARYPRRFYDKRGEAMWLRVQSTLAELGARVA